MKQLIACCGLNCENCDARIATINNDNELREKTAKKWSELNNVEITAEAINCMGCRIDGMKTIFCSTLCEICKCVYAKGFDTCGDCKELESCLIVGTILKHAPEAKENLYSLSK